MDCYVSLSFLRPSLNFYFRCQDYSFIFVRADFYCRAGDAYSIEILCLWVVDFCYYLNLWNPVCSELSFIIIGLWFSNSLAFGYLDLDMSVLVAHFLPLASLNTLYGLCITLPAFETIEFFHDLGFVLNCFWLNSSNFFL